MFLDAKQDIPIKQNPVVEEEKKESHMPPPQQAMIFEECPICYESFDGTEVISLSNCGHMFHQECVDYYLENDIKSVKCPLMCPEASCKQAVSESDMKKCLS